MALVAAKYHDIARRQFPDPPDSPNSISPRSQVRYSLVPGVCGIPVILAPGGHLDAFNLQSRDRLR